jgi:DMSO/TMAO reductase YedYZ molybdopterin-dependent catalytic subunit
MDREEIEGHAERLLPEGGAGRVVSVEPINVESAPEALRGLVTPVGGHFVRAHFALPALDRATHRVHVEGGVWPLVLRLADLMRRARRSLLVTLECAGNGRLGIAPLPQGEPWSRGAVATALWTGVPLGAVLREAGVPDHATAVLARGADEGTVAGRLQPFQRALPIEKALDGDTLLAFEMNGRPLAPEHGAPVRLIVPGWYGMASVKWLSELRFVSAPFDGYFQRDRYVLDDGEGELMPVAEMPVSSFIVAPREHERVPLGRLRAWGWAWSGRGAIAQVAVSLDAGPWINAQLEPPAAPYAWVRWTAELSASRRGRCTLRSRARDATGTEQPLVARWNRWGYGNNAAPLTRFDVR